MGEDCDCSCRGTWMWYAGLNRLGGYWANLHLASTGKTAASVALARLFGFGHTQSDDIKSKKTASTFQRNIVELLKTHDVVIADR